MENQRLETHFSAVYIKIDNPQRSKCFVCAKEFPDNNRFRRHLRTHTAEKRFECILCKKKFALNQYLLKHMKLRHKDYKELYPCPICHQKFTNWFTMKAHQKTHKSKEPRKCKKLHQCVQCSERFRSNRELRVHFRLHMEKKLFQCSHCPKTFGQRQKMWQHRKNVHAVRKYTKCRFCEKKFSDTESLKLHMRLHTPQNKPFECAFCAKRLSSKNLLILHLALHSEEKPFMCSMCGATFALHRALRSHNRWHINERRPKCALCGKQFYRKLDIRRHMMRFHFYDADNKVIFEEQSRSQNQETGEVSGLWYFLMPAIHCAWFARIWNSCVIRANKLRIVNLHELLSIHYSWIHQIHNSRSHLQTITNNHKPII